MTPREYEDKVRQWLEQRVFREWPDSPAQFYARKHYGGISGHPHEIDVSVEFEFAGFSFLIIGECKKHGRRVEITDLLAFLGRMKDIPKVNKGVFFSTGGYQEGAKKVADAHAIDLVHFSETRLAREISRSRLIIPLSDTRKSFSEFPQEDLNHQRSHFASINADISMPSDYPYRSVIEETLGAVDQIHPNLGLPTIRIVLSRKSEPFFQDVCYRVKERGKAGEILLPASPLIRRIPLLHGIGHLIAHTVLGNGSFLSLKSSEELSPSVRVWRDVIWNTAAYSKYRERMWELSRGGSASELGIQLAHLGNVDELWARSYSQFIALHTSNSGITNEFEATRKQLPYYYWESEDFESVDTAMIKLLITREG